MSKKIRVLLALALALAVCLAGVPASFAASTDPAVATDAAAITKVLQVPYGTAIPSTMSFSFTVTKKSVDGDTTLASTAPTIGTAGVVTIPYGSGTTLEGTTAGVSTYYKESANLFPSTIVWPHAGVYEYEIAETGTYTVNPTPPPTEVMTSSQAKYTVFVYVAANATTGVLEITHIGVLKTTTDGGTAIPGTSQEKEDPTPGGGTDGTDTWDYSQLIFTNSYVKTNGGTDPTDPDDWTLAVSKAVAGTYSDPNLYFGFTMTVTKPTLAAGTTYTAFVVEPTNVAGVYAVVTGSANYAGTIGVDGSITVTSGTPFVFNLKHNEQLVFIDTPVGTSYTVAEPTGTAGYAPKAVVTYNGTPGAQEVKAAGASLTLPHASNSVYTSPLYVGEAANSAAFLNDRGTITPTGIDMNNLPYYVLLAAVALGGVFYIVVRSRRRAREEA